MTTTCHTCHLPLNRGDAVLRGDGVTQHAFHPTCFTIHRAVKDVVAVEVEREETIGLTLAQRLERAGYKS